MTPLLAFAIFGAVGALFVFSFAADVSNFITNNLLPIKTSAPELTPPINPVVKEILYLFEIDPEGWTHQKDPLSYIHKDSGVCIDIDVFGAVRWLREPNVYISKNEGGLIEKEIHKLLAKRINECGTQRLLSLRQ